MQNQEEASGASGFVWAAALAGRSGPIPIFNSLKSRPREWPFELTAHKISETEASQEEGPWIAGFGV
jgi:hypothetical protein